VRAVTISRGSRRTARGGEGRGVMGCPCVCARRTSVNYFDRTNFLANYPDMIITSVATLMYRRVLAPPSLCEIVYILPCYAANIKINTLSPARKSRCAMISFVNVITRNSILSHEYPARARARGESPAHAEFRELRTHSRFAASRGEC